MDIRPGQIYTSCNPDKPGRIKICHSLSSWARAHGPSKVEVVTLFPDGRRGQPRPFDRSQLHDSATTRLGAPRRTGYVLVTKDSEAAR